MLANIIDRDKRDSSRKEAPLMQAKDAIYIDSTDLTIEEVTEKIIKIIKEKSGIIEKNNKVNN